MGYVECVGLFLFGGPSSKPIVHVVGFVVVVFIVVVVVDVVVGVVVVGSLFCKLGGELFQMVVELLFVCTQFAAKVLLEVRVCKQGSS